MAIDLTPYKLRLAALEKEGCTALGITSDAVGYFFHTQEGLPYWTNRTGEIDVDSNGEEIDVYTVTVIGRLYLGHTTDEITRGEVEQRLDTWVLALVEYFNERELLQTAAYPDAPDDLTRFRVTAARGYTEFLPDGKIGTEFTYSLELERQIVQAYN